MNRIRASRIMKCLMLATIGCTLMSTAGAVPAEDDVFVEVRRSKGPSLYTPTGAPIQIISTMRRVSYTDLDLMTHGGVMQLEARIQKAARTACATLERHFPFSSSSANRRLCVQQAVAEAMVQARAAITAAEMRTRTAHLTDPQ